MERRDKKKWGKGVRDALAKLGNRCSIPTPMGFHSKADIDKASPDVSLWYPIDPDPILRVTRCVPQNGSSIGLVGEDGVLARGIFGRGSDCWWIMHPWFRDYFILEILEGWCNQGRILLILSLFNILIRGNNWRYFWYVGWG